MGLIEDIEFANENKTERDSFVDKRMDKISDLARRTGTVNQFTLENFKNPDFYFSVGALTLVPVKSVFGRHREESSQLNYGRTGFHSDGTPEDIKEAYAALSGSDYEGFQPSDSQVVEAFLKGQYGRKNPNFGTWAALDINQISAVIENKVGSRKAPIGTTGVTLDRLTDGSVGNFEFDMNNPGAMQVVWKKKPGMVEYALANPATKEDAEVISGIESEEEVKE